MKLPKEWRRWAAITAAVLFALLFLDYWLYPFWGQQGPPPRRLYQNALWLRYTWYFGEHSDAEVEQLAEKMTQHNMRDAYFHVRYIKKDGSLRFRYLDRARKLNATLKKAAPKIRRFAWIYAGHGKQGDVDLTIPEVRQKMAEEAAWLVRGCGFDGVQWDYEICPDGDLHFLDLLERTRELLPKGAPISVAAPMWFPIKGIGWSPAYYTSVAGRCDQVAVMCYDSGFYFPRDYCWLVERQLRVIPQALAKENPKCELVLGLATYEEGPFSHNSRAENLTVGLYGVRKSLTAAGADSMVGVAIFADYTTDDDEWKDLRRLWIPNSVQFMPLPRQVADEESRKTPTIETLLPTP